MQLLGLPLDEATRRLHAIGVEPTIATSYAPRRKEGDGELRVVRVSEGGDKLTVCAFWNKVKELP